MSKIIIDPLQVATLDLEALESDAYASGDAGLAALVARLIDADTRWDRLMAHVDQFQAGTEDAAEELVVEVYKINEETES